MSTIPIAHKRCECIGCGLCIETAPDYWFMNVDGEAELRQILRHHQGFECGEGFTQDKALHLAAEEGCPVNVIRIG